MSVCVRHTAVRWLAYIESPKTPHSFSALFLFTSFMKWVKMIVPGFMETLCRCVLTYCKPFGRDWVALCHLILHHPKERGVQIFLAHVAGISSRPLFLLYVLKVENCPFSFPGFTFSQGADTKSVGEHCKEAYKVHIADLLLKSPRCLALTPTIKTFLPVWCVPASSLNHTSLLLCLLPSQSGSFFFFFLQGKPLSRSIGEASLTSRGLILHLAYTLILQQSAQCCQMDRCTVCLVSIANARWALSSTNSNNLCGLLQEHSLMDPLSSLSHDICSNITGNKKKAGVSADRCRPLLPVAARGC